MKRTLILLSAGGAVGLTAISYLMYLLLPVMAPAFIVYRSPFLEQRIVALSKVAVPIRGETETINWIKSNKSNGKLKTLKDLAGSNDINISLWSLYLLADVYPAEAKGVAVRYQYSEAPEIRTAAKDILKE